MEPINAVYINEENMLGDTEQEDSVSMPVPERSKDVLQEKKFALCYEQNDVSVVEKLLFRQTVQSTLLVRSDASNYSVSNQSGGSITSTASPLNRTCAICLQTFSTWELLIKHIFTHILNVNWPLHICHLCGKVFLNSSMMYAHNFHHSKKTIFKGPTLFELSCAFCSQTLTQCSLIKHVFSHILAICAPLYVCTYCSGVFGDMAKLSFHKRISRGSQRRAFYDCHCNRPTYGLQVSTTRNVKNCTNEELFSSSSYKQSNGIIQSDEQSPGSEISNNSLTLLYCLKRCQKKHTNNPCLYNFCEKTFINPPHQKLQHEHQISSVVHKKYFRNSATNKSHKHVHLVEQELSCETCGKYFKHFWSLNKHKRTHLGERPFSCILCAKSFTTSGSLKTHNRIHLGERQFSCKVCAKKFSQSGQLNRHKRIHSKERLFCCEVCGKYFTESGSLKRHMRIHSGEQPFSCLVCGKSFTQSNGLKTHNRIHSGEKPFSCEICGKCFTNSSNLKRHNRIHSGKRPFSCAVCGKSFTQSSNLKKHNWIHLAKRPFSCEFCGNSFIECEKLKIHKRIHSGERPFCCEICGKCFIQSRDLKVHNRIH